MDSLYLDPDTWDLTLTADGDIAVAKSPYSTAQSVANAVRLFNGELYYDTSKGVPYFDEVLGKPHSYAFFKYRMEEAARRVNGVTDVNVSISSQNGRVIVGTVSFKDENNETYKVNL